MMSLYTCVSFLFLHSITGKVAYVNGITLASNRLDITFSSSFAAFSRLTGRFLILDEILWLLWLLHFFLYSCTILFCLPLLTTSALFFFFFYAYLSILFISPLPETPTQFHFTFLSLSLFFFLFVLRSLKILFSLFFRFHLLPNWSRLPSFERVSHKFKKKSFLTILQILIIF